MPSQPRILLAALAVFLLGLLVVVAGGSTPAACAGCHAMRGYATALNGTAHASSGCYGCHLSSAWDWPAFKVRELTVMYPNALLGRGVSGPGDRTSSASCLSCHNSVRNHVTQRHGLRISHAACVSEGEQCDSCHAVHGTAARWKRQPVMEECVLCHMRKQAKTACDTCHLEREQRERLARGPWQVTHGPQWRSTHGMGQIRYCVICHAEDYCARCHGLSLPHPPDFGQSHGKEAIRLKIARCASCHDQKGFCDSCHGVPMPHPSGFVKEHVKVAKQRRDPDCTRCHDVRDCNTCHAEHAHPGNTQGTLNGRQLPQVKR